MTKFETLRAPRALTSGLCNDCDVMWDEHQPLASIVIGTLRQEHVTILNRVPLTPERQARCIQCGVTHWVTPGIIRRWRQCTTCGATWCPTHSKQAAPYTCNFGDCHGVSVAL
jgi:hypothetical protein